MRITARRNPRILKQGQTGGLTRDAVAQVAYQLDKLFRKLEKDLFDSEGSTGGQHWKPLTPRYKLWKDARFAMLGASQRARAKAHRREQRKLSKPERTRLERDRGPRAENKILQLTGQMKQAFSTSTAEHIAEGRAVSGTRMRFIFGASGPKYYEAHKNGNPSKRLPVRDQVQMTDAQKRDMVNLAAAVLRPYVMREIRDRFVVR